MVARVAREGCLGHAPQRNARAFLPHGALGRRVDPERVELGRGRALTGAELDPSAGEHVERGDALRDARRVVDGGHRVHDAVTEADPLRALRHRGEEEVGRARM